MLAESPVEGGMILIPNHLTDLLQREAFPDVIFRHHHPAVGHKIVECHIRLLLEHLGHGGHTDTAVGGNDPQGDPLIQMSIYISRDLLQHGVFSLCGTGAFLTDFFVHLFRKDLLLKLEAADYSRSVNS